MLAGDHIVSRVLAIGKRGQMIIDRTRTTVRVICLNICQIEIKKKQNSFPLQISHVFDTALRTD